MAALLGLPAQTTLSSGPSNHEGGMNFYFSDEAKLLRDQARRFLKERCPPKAVRRVLEGEMAWDAALWREIAQMGWLGTAVTEEFGGAGLGYEGLCLLAEEIGAAL